MLFRPLPVLTAACIPALALLLTLGVWQVQRAQWKAALVAEMEAREAAPPSPLGEAICAGGEGRVSVDLVLGPDPLRIYGAGPTGEAGWLIVQPAYGPQCVPGAQSPLRVLVQTGFEDLNGVRSEAPRTLSLEPWPEAGGFTPQNASDRGEYYRFVAADLSAALGLAENETLSPLWARWDSRPAAERVSIAPATHIGYAVTWFGLAAALVAIYLVMHFQAGRLRLRP